MAHILSTDNLWLDLNTRSPQTHMTTGIQASVISFTSYTDNSHRLQLQMPRWLQSAALAVISVFLDRLALKPEVLNMCVMVTQIWSKKPNG